MQNKQINNKIKTLALGVIHCPKPLDTSLYYISPYHILTHKPSTQQNTLLSVIANLHSLIIPRICNARRRNDMDKCARVGSWKCLLQCLAVLAGFRAEYLLCVGDSRNASTLYSYALLWSSDALSRATHFVSSFMCDRVVCWVMCDRSADRAWNGTKL